jgi:hypothetical protein
MATAEMHTAKAVASAMTSAEMSATAVTTTAVTTTAVTTAAVTATASRQRRTRQHGRDNQNGNSNAGLRHAICSGLVAFSIDAGRNRKFPAPMCANYGRFKGQYVVLLTIVRQRFYRRRLVAFRRL